MAPAPDLPTRRWPFIVGIGAFAIALTVGPMIATRGINAGGSGEAYAAGNAGMVTARAAAAHAAQAVEETPTAVPVFIETSETPATSPSTTVGPTMQETPVPAATEETPATAAPLDGGSVALALEVVPPTLGDGDTATWTITVANDGDEYLWGIYAYLEGVGPVPCADRQLEVGASTICVTESPVWFGSQEAVAWATAWTALRMVESDARLAYTVGG